MEREGKGPIDRPSGPCWFCHVSMQVDFVPNHLAVDHPWTKEAPELLIQGSDNSRNEQPQNFFKVTTISHAPPNLLRCPPNPAQPFMMPAQPRPTIYDARPTPPNVL